MTMEIKLCSTFVLCVTQWVRITNIIYNLLVVWEELNDFYFKICYIPLRLKLLYCIYYIPLKTKTVIFSFLTRDYLRL